MSTPEIKEAEKHTGPWILIGRYSDGSGISDKALLFWDLSEAEDFIRRAYEIFGDGYLQAKILPAEDMGHE